MKIEYVKGDLFSTHVKHIMHGCNAQRVMGSGVALHIRNKHPLAYEAYLEWKDLHLGNIQLVPSNDKIIINAVTQQFYGKDGKKYASYDAIELVMKKVNFALMTDNVTEVAMPKIGSALGGGNWNIIEKIIEETIKEVKPIVYYLE